jgi:hypothetical protein
VLLLKHLFVVIEGFAASPITRMGASVEDGWRRVYLNAGTGTSVLRHRKGGGTNLALIGPRGVGDAL